MSKEIVTLKILSRRDFLLGALGLAISTVLACNNKGEETVSSSRELSTALAVSLENQNSPSAGKAIESFNKKHRYWEKADLAISKYVNDKTLVRISEITFRSNPPFYKKAEPLRVSSHRISYGPFGVDTIIKDSFGQFTNFYVYDNPMTVVGAQTYSNNGDLLAEAFLEYPAPKIINTAQAHFYLHEVHYDKKGNTQFIAKSELDRSGIKIGEVAYEGKKENEYYFLFERG